MIRGDIKIPKGLQRVTHTPGTCTFHTSFRIENKVKLCPFTRITKIKESPFYRGVDLWNSLK